MFSITLNFIIFNKFILPSLNFAKNINSPFIHLWYIAILMQLELVFPIIFTLLKKIESKVSKYLPFIIMFILLVKQNAVERENKTFKEVKNILTWKYHNIKIEVIYRKNRKNLLNFIQTLIYSKIYLGLVSFLKHIIK